MLGIFGVNGQIFSGQLEELPDIRMVGRRPPVMAIGTDGAELGDAAANPPLAPDREAVAAYNQMLHIDEERGPLVHARQIMRPQVIHVAAGDEVVHAWRTLTKHRVHQAPVLGRDRGLVGIVSERDLLTALNVDHEEIRDALARQVADVMTSPVIAADPLTDIRRIARVMLEYDVTGVPILDSEQQMVGFVSRGDVLRAVIADPPLSLWR